MFRYSSACFVRTFCIFGIFLFSSICSSDEGSPKNSATSEEVSPPKSVSETHDDDASERWSAEPGMPPIDKEAIARLLASGQFQDVELIFDEFLSAVSPQSLMWNSASEWRLIQTFRAIGSIQPEYQGLVSGWAAARPESWSAQVALSFSQIDLALEARGKKFVSATPKDHFQNMEAFLDDATKSARRALEINPKAWPAYRVLVIREKLQRTSNVGLVISEALGKFPYSFYLRVNILEALQPRWGGNYNAMVEFAQASQQFSEINPQLRVLLGYPYWGLGQDYYSAEKYADAIEVYTKALSFGDDDSFYKRRSYAKKKAGQMDQSAKDDWATGLRLFPTP